jgi:hypothetical protein
MELFSDLCLADCLLHNKLCAKVVFHAKVSQNICGKLGKCGCLVISVVRIRCDCSRFHVDPGKAVHQRRRRAQYTRKAVAHVFIPGRRRGFINFVLPAYYRALLLSKRIRSGHNLKTMRACVRPPKICTRG